MLIPLDTHRCKRLLSLSFFEEREEPAFLAVEKEKERTTSSLDCVALTHTYYDPPKRCWASCLNIAIVASSLLLKAETLSDLQGKGKR